MSTQISAQDGDAAGTGRPAERRTGRKARSWADLSPGAKRGTVVGAAVQLALLTAALRDIARRPQNEIRGPKGMWVAVSFINFVGPVAYFVFGHQRVRRH
ncbi:Phospholipase_D-nuclease N-terminal [Nakamurella panacisegetis]|uniref:Phospholipase_D-nuclease N-terminal n=1 Tax=Nakamurella panacisegetis TaxID=1090615 RepID=A0A1H0S9J3_9ACTN|nr:PLD nuclease N-terminal domain-containing protein [Nakamurella panacisegetis]SDP38462.1 Phospholipase_D-nuclease N-terminal [Nakamurella panacisegetis]